MIKVKWSGEGISKRYMDNKGYIKYPYSLIVNMYGCSDRALRLMRWLSFHPDDIKKLESSIYDYLGRTISAELLIYKYKYDPENKMLEEYFSLDIDAIKDLISRAEDKIKDSDFLSNIERIIYDGITLKRNPLSNELLVVEQPKLDKQQWRKKCARIWAHKIDSNGNSNASEYYYNSELRRLRNTQGQYVMDWLYEEFPSGLLINKEVAYRRRIDKASKRKVKLDMTLIIKKLICNTQIYAQDREMLITDMSHMMNNNVTYIGKKPWQEYWSKVWDIFCNEAYSLLPKDTIILGEGQ